jgi:hypothetical protein
MPVESGLHKFLGIYRELPRLLKEVGIDLSAMLTWVDALELHNEQAQSAYFGVAPYHHPLRTLGGILGNNRYVSVLDKLRLAHMGLRGIVGAMRGGKTTEKIDMATFARQSGLSDRAMRDVLLPMTAGPLFLPPEEFSAYQTFLPVLEGLKIGVPAGSLQRRHDRRDDATDRRCRRAARRRGGDGPGRRSVDDRRRPGDGHRDGGKNPDGGGCRRGDGPEAGPAAY